MNPARRVLRPLAERIDERCHAKDIGAWYRGWCCDVYDWTIGVPLRILLQERKEPRR